MPSREALTASKVVSRIIEREDNIYKKDVILNILNMYMDECRKALIKGERIQISKVGTIIPDVKVRMSFNMPCCNKECGNPPYTKIRMSTNYSLREEMNRTLIKNIKKGIWGLEKTPLSKQQLNILKENGYISKDTEGIDLNDKEKE